MNRLFCSFLLLATSASGLYAGEQSTKPNILIILADDLGYADLGFQGCKDIPTPNLDQLAARSLRCTNGYVSHPFCSPTRAGLLTGRYQQRFGHENNPAWLPEDAKAGLPLSQRTIADVLRLAGYRTGCVGKWHLGAHPSFHPNRRGFDHYFGILGGGHLYLPNAKGGVEYSIPLDRNGKKEEFKGHLTDVFGREAADFVKDNKARPWMLYLAFNAPHTPLQPSAKSLERVKGIEDEKRRNYAGLVVGMDDAIGVVLDALRESGQEEDTMVIFLSDNGGPTEVTNSRNFPLRGAKGSIFEGGVRIPFLISWPARLPKGKDFAEPISSLDILPTAAALARTKVDGPIDGVDLMPHLKGEKKGPPHERLFWRTNGGVTWAVREGNWKLASPTKGIMLLFDLKTDIGESEDLAASRTEVVRRLMQAYEDWNRDNVAPLFQSPGAKSKKQ